MGKFIRIYEFAQQLFSGDKTARQANEIIEGIMTACSPRIENFGEGTFQDGVWQDFSGRLYYQPGSFTSLEDFRLLKARLANYELLG